MQFAVESLVCSMMPAVNSCEQGNSRQCMMAPVWVCSHSIHRASHRQHCPCAHEPDASAEHAELPVRRWAGLPGKLGDVQGLQAS